VDLKSARSRLKAIADRIESHLPESVDRHTDDWVSVVGGHGLSHLNVVKRDDDFRLHAAVGTQKRSVASSDTIASPPTDVTDESDEEIVRRILGHEPETTA
jgi:hypothetical protein